MVAAKRGPRVTTREWTTGGVAVPAITSSSSSTMAVATGSMIVRHEFSLRFLDMPHEPRGEGYEVRGIR